MGPKGNLTFRVGTAIAILTGLAAGCGPISPTENSVSATTPIDLVAQPTELVAPIGTNVAVIPLYGQEIPTPEPNLWRHIGKHMNWIEIPEFVIPEKYYVDLMVADQLYENYFETLMYGVVTSEDSQSYDDALSEAGIPLSYAHNRSFMRLIANAIVWTDPSIPNRDYILSGEYAQNPGARKYFFPESNFVYSGLDWGQHIDFHLIYSLYQKGDSKSIIEAWKTVMLGQDLAGHNADGVPYIKIAQDAMDDGITFEEYKARLDITE